LQKNPVKETIFCSLSNFSVYIRELSRCDPEKDAQNTVGILKVFWALCTSVVVRSHEFLVAASWNNAFSKNLEIPDYFHRENPGH